MDQMEVKEKSDDFETISNRFLDLKNGFVHEKPVTDKIFGFGLFFIRCSGWIRMVEKPEWRRKCSRRVLKPFPIDFSTSEIVKNMKSRSIPIFSVSDPSSSIDLD